MARHSSRNTAAATFTYHERSLLKYGTKRQRVGKESFRNPDDCNLCLERARQPICCPNGHLFCKECIMANLLAQKQDILRMKKQHNAREQKELRVKEGQNLNIQEESVAQFEKMQSGQHDTMKSKELFKKRKLENGVGNDKADVQIANSYWIPAYTPETNNAAPEVTKLNPICPASDEDAIHILKLKALIDVSFFDDIDGDSSGGRKACPCCSRSITVGVKIYLLKPCGHVMCKTCVDKFVRESNQCYVCNHDVSPSNENQGLILMNSDNASGGSGIVMVEKKEPAFQ